MLRCSKAHDTVNRAIKKHEMNNVEDSSRWEGVLDGFYIGQQFLTVFCEGDELQDGAQLSQQ